MTWHSKEQPVPFTSLPMPGLQFLHGDVIAKRYRQDWTAGKKYPLIQFPSGLEREVLAGSDQPEQPAIHIFGALAIPYHSTRDAAYETSLSVASDYGYEVSAQGNDTLVIVNPDAGRSYRLTYDNDAQTLVDLVHFPEEAMELLDGESRAVLPPLYSTEKQGLAAVAPVKFFTPAGGWTWYATEFDGKDIFFGLVAGLDLELGYFSLSELEGIRAPFGLPIERDLYFTPTPLQTIQTWHQQ